MFDIVTHSNISINLKFHHLGYATKSIEKEKAFISILGYKQEGDFFLDPIQGVKGCFFVGDGPRIELLENLSNSQTLTPWIKQDIKIYHIAYKVKNMEESLSFFCNQKARIITNSVPSVAFNGSLISFVMLRNKLLIELIEQS